MTIDKDQVFEILDEWAETRGLLRGAQGSGIGESYDFGAFIRSLYGVRPVGEEMGKLLREAPTRFLYPHEGNTEREQEVLAYMKGVIESDPNWFTLRIGGASIARVAATEEGPIEGLMVVPPVNLITDLPRSYAIRECEKWLTTQVNLAITADLAPDTSGGFVAGTRLRRG